MTISSAVAALIKRMDEHPEEFVSERWDPVISDAENFLYKTRWETVSEMMNATDPIFTPEEATAYMAKLRGMLRTRADESIIKELVGYAKKNSMDAAEAYRQKQLSLPLGTSSLNAASVPNSILTTAGVTQQALAILEGQFK